MRSKVSSCCAICGWAAVRSSRQLVFANASGLKSAKELAIAAPFAIIHCCVVDEKHGPSPRVVIQEPFAASCTYMDAKKGKIGLFDKVAPHTSDYPKCSPE